MTRFLTALIVVYSVRECGLIMQLKNLSQMFKVDLVKPGLKRTF